MPPTLNYGKRLKPYAFGHLKDDKKINITVGSVRSGKTWSSHAKILRGCAYRVSGWRLITGISKNAIFNNVLNDLFNLVGPKHYKYNHQTGILILLGTTWLVMGAHDEGSEKILRGLTVGIAVCDEVVLMPETFFKMLITRMSPEGSRFYGTTNPDNPKHWLKKDYIDDEKTNAAGLIQVINVTMDDNPNLTDEYKELVKNTMKGLFYERFILGRWVMAEGSIYRDCWNDLRDVYDAPPIGLRGAGGHVRRWMACDYGTVHPHVYGEFFDDGKNIYLENEYVWDSKERQEQKTDAQYADALDEFMGKNNRCQVIVPPEAASFKTELALRGFWVSDADNEVENGIKTVASIMGKGMLRVNRRCKRTIDRLPLYAWDPKKSEKGEEQPIKSDDDECDMVRYGLHGIVPVWRFTI